MAKIRSNQSCIMITKGKYNDTITILDEGLCRIYWEGQNKRFTHDKIVNVDTNVFVREKTGVPYTYIGKVIDKKIINERTEDKPIKLKLIVADYQCDYKNHICDAIIEEDSYKFQNACWRSINLKPFKCNGHGIYVF